MKLYRFNDNRYAYYKAVFDGLTGVVKSKIHLNGLDCDTHNKALFAYHLGTWEKFFESI